MAQLHKKFTSSQVKELFKHYLAKEIKRDYIQEILGIKRRQFCKLISRYKDNPNDFSIGYVRKKQTRSIPDNIENNILKELHIEKKLINDKNIPIRFYNYSYIKERLKEKYQQEVSLPTIISRAKKYDFYFKKPKRKAHDREVLTNHIGELIQHDSSVHLFAPSAQEKWHLITSIDDFSRYMLYATLLKRETSWTHIDAAQTVFLKYGLPFSYYVDSHSIFRFVQGRDSLWRKHSKLTDDVDTQWKQVFNDCNVKVIYALSPQAKGKIERPYQWLQDHLVRTCVRDNVTLLSQAQRILNNEVHRYNYRQVHSTTGEVPYFRFKKALKEKQSLFREFKIRKPYKSVKDIFCLRIDRTADAYRKISINNLRIKVNGVNPGNVIELRISPINKGLTEVRFWHKDRLLDIQKFKNKAFEGVHF